MAKRKEGDNKEIIIHQLDITQLNRNKVDIESWRNALKAAENKMSPKRFKLIELYNEIMLDAHLSAVIEKRRMSVTNSDIQFIKNGKPDEEITDNVLRTPWFMQMVRHILDTRFWGHTLLEFGWGTEGLIDKTILIPRHHVDPVKGLVKFNPSAEEGIPFREPPYVNFLVEVGEKDDLGLLAKAAPYVLYKRGSVSDWAQYAEIFGIPMRVGYYDPHDNEVRLKMTAAMQEAGSAPWMVLPTGGQFEVKDGAKAEGSAVFQQLVTECNKEISKLILGQTMTTENGSSLSQAEVHKEVEEEINSADKVYVEHVLNWEFKTVLQNLGYQVEGGEFRFPDIDKTDIKTQYEIVMGLIGKIEIPKGYVYERFNIPQPDGGEEIIETPDEPYFPVPSPGKEPTGLLEYFWNGLKAQFEKKKPLKVRRPEYSSCCSGTIVADSFHGLEEIERQMLEAIASDEGTDFYTPYFQALVDTYLNAIQIGYDREYDLNAPDHLQLSMMEANIFRFSATKTLAMANELNRIFDESSTFADFKEAAEAVFEEYNGNYLRTEYNTAHAIAQNAANYNRLVADKDVMPYWEYLTAGDSRVRPAHQSLDGMIFRADDPAFDVIFPPNGWNCRCDVIPRNDTGGKELSNKDKAVSALKETGEYDKMKKGRFLSNRGKLSVVFAENSFYVKDDLDERMGIRHNGVTPWEDIPQGSLPKLQLGDRNEDWVQSWFKSHIGKNDLDNPKMIRFLDYRNKPVHLEAKTVKKHLKRRYLNKGRQNYFEFIPEVLADPDEVYINRYNNTFSRYYLKFYQGQVIAAASVLGETEAVETIYPVVMGNLDENVRVGVLAFNKKRF